MLSLTARNAVQSAADATREVMGADSEVRQGTTCSSMSCTQGPGRIFIRIIPESAEGLWFRWNSVYNKYILCDTANATI